jgi:hypothetical protein
MHSGWRRHVRTVGIAEFFRQGSGQKTMQFVRAPGVTRAFLTACSPPAHAAAWNTDQVWMSNPTPPGLGIQPLKKMLIVEEPNSD